MSIQGLRNKILHHQGTKFFFVSRIAAGETEWNCMVSGFGFSWCLGGVPYALNANVY
jgi:hypothetical protein